MNEQQQQTYLIQVSIGPVQGFISAARRTRDFWYGSTLLSEISGKVSQVLGKAGTGELLIPAKGNGGNVPNVILAQVTTDNPQGVVEECRKAAQEAWREKEREVFEEYGNVIEKEIWETQQNDVLEFYGAWVPVNGDFQRARTQAARLLAGRKLIRDFRQAEGVSGKPKSSLDAARESVLKDSIFPTDYNRLLRKGRVRCSREKGGGCWTPTEQLDLVGMVKRFGGDSQQYPSVARIAADPWLRKLSDGDRERLKEWVENLKRRSGYSIAGYDVTKFPQFKKFPYEGIVIYPTRLADLQEDPKGDLEEPLRCFRDKLLSLHRKYHPPSPYYAVLRADGDRMGKVLSNLDTTDAVKKFSEELEKFSRSAEKTVRKHSGCVIYAGGDDVLAFVPLDQCLSCAKVLHEEFGECMKKNGSPATMSVGIAVAHFMEPMSAALEWSREAEKDAKEPDRNGLAIHYHTRGGSPVKVRDRWEDGINGRLEEWIGYFRENQIPDKAPYDIREIVKAYEGWDNPEQAKDALSRDLKRLIEKKRTREGKKLEEEVKNKIEGFMKKKKKGKESEPPEHRALTLARELLIARQLAMSGETARDRSPSRREEGENNHA